MAHLEKLVVQGFKSFKRKTSIPFPAGFSAITGPNGSGKSNIGDAISFVLGKSSSKAMRAKKAGALIFYGGKNKGASDFANVVLTLNNTTKTLPIKEKNISIGRRMNKKGVSTYRMNGRVVTRQQIVDLLSQIGIHPDGHNIVRQGDVNHIVEMDAVQRRGMIDEISGIREFDEKRNKAAKELEKVAEKVREAELLLAEKTQVMEKLHADRNAAMECQKLQDDLEKIKISITLKDYSHAKESMREICAETAAKEKEFTAAERTVASLDRQLEKEEHALQRLTKEVVRASSQIEVSKKIARLQSSIEGKKERIASLYREAERLDALIERVSRIENKVHPGIKEILGFPGVKGVLLDLIVVPKDYRIAVEVAGGSHLRDVVVDRMETAVKCVSCLKVKRLGRARFLPLNKIMSGRRGQLPDGAVGWLSDLIRFDSIFTPAMEYVFGRTACVSDIETAKAIQRRQRVRMVTLDGDLVEASGAVTGGYYRKAGMADVRGSLKEKQSLLKEAEELEEIVHAMGKELALLAEKERKTTITDIEKERQGLDTRLERFRTERKKAYEQRLFLQQELGRLNIQKAKIEARFDNLKLQVPGKKDIPVDRPLGQLRAMEKGCLERLQEIGPVNMKAIDEFDAIVGEFEEFKEKVDTISEEQQAIQNSINEIEEKRLATFSAALNSVSKHFKHVYRELTDGNAELALENFRDLDSGLVIRATPPGKKMLTIDVMSGGEKTLTAFAFLFALQKHKPSPFYILDEADATLDRVNTTRVVTLLQKQSKDAQFIVVSHNETMVRAADQIFGVTAHDGESKVIGIELPDEET